MAARKRHPLLLGALVLLLVVQSAAAALPHLHHHCDPACDAAALRSAPEPGASKPCLACALHVPVVAPAPGTPPVRAAAATSLTPPARSASLAGAALRDARSRGPPPAA